MKRLLTLFVAIAIFSQLLQAQDSRGFSFQGIARDGSGNIFSNQDIEITFYLLTSTTLSSAIYEETQIAKTDAFGVFSAIIGKGTAKTGTSYVAKFSDIDFSKQLFIQVNTKIGTSVPTTLVQYELQSVPYAKYASNGVPAGSIMPFGGTAVPEGWVLCDGAVYNRADAKYAALFAAIGTNWGNASNSTTQFNVPDLRGVFLRGQDGGRELDPDRESRIAVNGGNDKNKVGSYQVDNQKSHTHGVGTYSAAVGGSHTHIQSDVMTEPEASNTKSDLESFGYWWTKRLSDNYVASGDGGYSDVWSRNTASSGNHSHTLNGNSAPTGENETRPKNVYVNYIIKL